MADELTHIAEQAGVDLREAPTTNYGFTKPDVGGSDDIWGTEWNANLDSIDANLYRIDTKPSGIAADATPTTGFEAGQVMISDGTVTKPWTHGVSAQLGDASWPLAITGYTVPDGVNNHFEFTSSNNAVFVWVGPGGYAGVEIPGGSNGGIITQQSFFGFTTGTNSPTFQPDAALTAIETATCGFRDMSNGADPSALRVYNTFTDYNDGEWGALDWRTAPGTLTIGAQANGTGVVRPVNIVGASLTFNGQPIGGGLPLTGGNLTGPLNINTATQPMMTLGWPQDTTLMQFTANSITLNGNGGPGPAISNKTFLGVNQVGFGHKSYQGGNTPIYLSQSNQGEFYIALGAGAPVAFSDMKNGHPVKVSSDAGNAIVYGSDGAIFVPHGAMMAERITELEATVAALLTRLAALEG